MPKIPDLSELSKKLDIQGIVDSVKSAISSGPSISKPPTGDELAAKFAELNELVQNLARVNAEQAQAIAKVNGRISGLYRDMLALRAPVESPSEVSAASEAEQEPPKSSVDDEHK